MAYGSPPVAEDALTEDELIDWMRNHAVAALYALDETDDRIFVLEDALVEAFNLAEFLYHCLTTDGYTHAYPHMTRETLDQLRPVVPPRLMCVHSGTVEGCESTQQEDA